MSHSDKAQAADDDDTEEQNLLDDDPFLSLTSTSKQTVSDNNTNFSRPRRYQSPETSKSRFKLELPESSRLSRQRFSETTPSESTDNTWATAASQQNSSPNPNMSRATEDDTIKVHTLSRSVSNTSYPEQAPTQDSPNNSKAKGYMPRRKIEAPMSPQNGSVSSTSMWNELEAIKRRLRQLELGHPSTTGDRPQTRGTTNSSSSPQRSSPFPSHTGTSITSTSSPSSYPLLNAAITKVKASGLSIDITQAIEATAQEAISLTLLANHDHSVQPPSPRTIRKRVDGVCRGLTEVCLALADHQQSSHRQQTRAAIHRAEDAQDSSPLSATGRQSMTLSRSTARRMSNGTNTSRTASTVSRSRRPANSVIGLQNEEFEDDAMSGISPRPGLSRYSTIQYRPPSRAATEVYSERTPPSSNLQRYSTTRRSLLSRHGPSMSDYNIPVSDHDSPAEEIPMPRTATRSTFAAPNPDNRRRSLNLSTYFSSPPRARTEFSRESSLPMPSSRPASLISPPRVNVPRNTSDSGDRTDATIRRRPTASVAGDKVYVTDIEEDLRSTTLGRSATNPHRRSMGGNMELRRHSSIKDRYTNVRDDS